MRPRPALVLALALLVVGLVVFRARPGDRRERAGGDVAQGAPADDPSASELRGARVDGETRTEIVPRPGAADDVALDHVRVRVRTAGSLAVGAASIADVPVVVAVVRVEPGEADRARPFGAAHPEPPAGAHAPVRAATDEAGELFLELPLPAAWRARDDGSTLALWGAVRGKGYERRAREIELDLDSSEREEPSLTLIARRGGTVLGRVEDRAGAPVEGVRVRLLQPDPEATGGWSSAYDHAVSDGDGAFAIHHDELGPRALLAIPAGLGSAFREDVEFSEDGARVGGDLAAKAVLVLAGDGVLGGVVEDPIGAPARGYRLWALPSDWREPSLHDAMRFQHVRADGLMDGSATTDARGAFRITGLRERAGERWHVWGYDGAERRFGPRLTDAPVAAGREDLRLVAQRSALVVRVRDEHGAPLAPRVASRWGCEVEDDVKLACARAAADGRLDPERSHREVPSRTLEDGEVVFDVEPDATYLVTAGSLRRAHRSVVARVERGAFETVVELRLPPETEPGTLALRVVAPDGEPYVETTNVTVRSIETDELLHESDDYHEGPEFTAGLPPGVYRVRVDVEPPGGAHGEVFDPTPFAPVVLEVAIRAGELTALDVSLGASGRLRALVHLPEGGGVGPAPTDERPLDAAIRGAAIELVPRDGGAALRPVFDVSYEEGLGFPVNLGGAQTGEAPDGIEVTSVNPIPVGRYTARLSAPGCGQLERELEIRAGQITRIEASLERQ